MACLRRHPVTAANSSRMRDRSVRVPPLCRAPPATSSSALVAMLIRLATGCPLSPRSPGNKPPEATTRAGSNLREAMRVDQGGCRGANHTRDGASPPMRPRSEAAMKHLGMLMAYAAAALVWGGPPAPAAAEAARGKGARTEASPPRAATEGRRAARSNRAAARVERGKASYYAPGLAGRRMADGGRFDPGSDAAAHRTLPLGSTARVRNLENGRTATVTVRDRGPRAPGRILDVSPRTAERLGMREEGVAPVEVAPVAVPRTGGQAGPEPAASGAGRAAARSTGPNVQGGARPGCGRRPPRATWPVSARPERPLAIVSRAVRAAGPARIREILSDGRCWAPRIQRAARAAEEGERSNRALVRYQFEMY